MLHTKGSVFKGGIGPSFLLAVYAIANVDPPRRSATLRVGIRTGERPIEDGLFLCPSPDKERERERDRLKFVNEIKKGMIGDERFASLRIDNTSNILRFRLRLLGSVYPLCFV